MSDETCAFCLGGTTEVPPFGSLNDAQDMIYPCSTCSLVTHRKCLVDWFNTLPYAQISRESSDLPSERGEHAGNGNDMGDFDPQMEPAHEDAESVEVVENGGENNDNVFDLSLRSRWFTVLGQYSSHSASSRAENRHAHHDDTRNTGFVRLSAACPQCKSPITFQIKNSRLMGLHRVLRNTVSDTVQYSGILLGLSGAATGVLTMGYVGLARCGVAMIDAIVPTTLISPLFNRVGSNHANKSLASSVNGATPYSITSQLKFNHIPLLPVMLYRMRYSSILECLFRKQPRISATEWIGEALICNYISSLGNHTLVRQLYKNARELLAKPGTAKLLQTGLLFRGIDWWHPAVMVGATIPARWLYDLAYRCTVNKLHFDLNTTVSPRDIANTMNPQDFSRLETLESQLASMKYSISQRMAHARKTAYFGLPREMVSLVRGRTLFRYIRLKVLHWFYTSKACLQHDYSSMTLYRSAILTGFTTVLWPFVSADLGKLVFEAVISRLPSLAHIEKDKLMFLSNLLAMALVAFLKDFVNLSLCYAKAGQVTELTVLTQRDSFPSSRQRSTESVPQFPGTYIH
ncbi:hypothetical protein OXX69_011260 [Metschnikowia pulcherrima]